MLLDGLSERTVSLIEIDDEIISQFCGIHFSIHSSGSLSTKRAFNRIRDHLAKAAALSSEDAFLIFGKAMNNCDCLAYRDFAYAIAALGTAPKIIAVADTSEWNRRTGVKKEKRGSPNTNHNVSKPEIDLEKVRFSRHAIERFVERHRQYKGTELFKPEGEARRILAKATESEAIDPIGKVVRIIDNNFVEARYFVFERWRFVVIEQSGGTLLVVTIELISRGIPKRVEASE